MSITTFILILELVGTVAFSVSGAMIGIQKNMDILGVMTLGLVTAVGGGIMRDLILGITPPATFKNPIYAITALITAAIVFLPWVQRQLHHYKPIYDMLLFAMDTSGLGIFTVIGVQTAFAQTTSCGRFLLIFVGVLTGVGGGVLRDTMAGLPPYIFVKHIYACASILGAMVCTFLWPILPGTWAMAIGALVVILIRCLSAHFRWSLPKSHPQEKNK